MTVNFTGSIKERKYIKENQPTFAQFALKLHEFYSRVAKGSITRELADIYVAVKYFFVTFKLECTISIELAM